MQIRYSAKKSSEPGGSQVMRPTVGRLSRTAREVNMPPNSGRAPETQSRPGREHFDSSSPFRPSANCPSRPCQWRVSSPLRRGATALQHGTVCGFSDAYMRAGRLRLRLHRRGLRVGPPRSGQLQRHYRIPLQEQATRASGAPRRLRTRRPASPIPARGFNASAGMSSPSIGLARNRARSPPASMPTSKVVSPQVVALRGRCRCPDQGRPQS